MSTAESNAIAVELVTQKLAEKGFSVTGRDRGHLRVVGKDSGKTLSIRVHAKKDSRVWLLNEREENPDGNCFYIFCRLGNETEKPEFHIVSSKAVAESIKNYHENYLKDENHTDTSMREFHDEDNKYLDKWDLLNQ